MTTSVPVRNSMPFDETVEWLETFSVSAYPDVEAKARLLLLDTVACAVAGMGEQELKNLAERFAVTSHGTVQWPGSTALSPASAAFLASVASCWHEACEGLARAHGRPGLHAIPVAVSLGLARHATFGQVLDAIVSGYEIGGRAGEAMRIRPGLHVDGTWGVFAASAAAARILRLDTKTTLQTLAMAACQIPTSLYAPITAGCTARNTYVGHAATLAIHLVDTTVAGITAPTDVFDQAGRNLGHGDVTTVWPWAAAGEFLILQGYLKPYAAVRHVHYAAACAMQRFTKRGGDTSDIAGLTLETYPEAILYCGNRNAKTPIQAQFSLTHGVTHAMRAGSLGPDAYAPQLFNDPEHARLEQMIKVHADPAMTGRGARLTITTKTGQETYATTSVLGDADQPFTAKDVQTKALFYMSPVVGPERAKAIVAHVMSASLESPFAFQSSSAPSC